MTYDTQSIQILQMKHGRNLGAPLHELPRGPLSGNKVRLGGLEVPISRAGLVKKIFISYVIVLLGSLNR